MALNLSPAGGFVCGAAWGGGLLCRILELEGTARLHLEFKSMPLDVSRKCIFIPATPPGEGERCGLREFPGTPWQSQRYIVDLRLRLELQFLGDGMVQNWMFQVESDRVSH